MKVDSFIYNKEKITSVFGKKYFEKLKGNKTETYNSTDLNISTKEIFVFLFLCFCFTNISYIT